MRLELLDLEFPIIYIKGFIPEFKFPTFPAVFDGVPLRITTQRDYESAALVLVFDEYAKPTYTNETLIYFDYLHMNGPYWLDTDDLTIKCEMKTLYQIPMKGYNVPEVDKVKKFIMNNAYVYVVPGDNKYLYTFEGGLLHG